MRSYRNLISDSILVQEAIDLLRLNGGCAPANAIAESVLKLPDIEPKLAAMVISDLIKDDGRIRITENNLVELLSSEDFETRLLNQTDFVVVDVETTGSKTPPSKIIEIGAYRISKGHIVTEFETLVNPEVNIPSFISSLTGITNSMVKDAPLFSDIVLQWLDFIDDAVLVAHNAPFDIRFLNHEISQIFPGRKMCNTHLCTLSLSRRTLQGLLNYRLHTVAEHLSIPIFNRHRAGGDALATAKILLHILKLLDQHNVTNLAEARNFYKQALK
jgi:DNA polymerase III epsilon subunit family exonuclease